MEHFDEGNEISIFTRNPEAVKEFFLFNAELRRLIKDFLFFATRHSRFQNIGGPSGVLSSLFRGFDELSVKYNFNPQKRDVGDVVCVLSGVEALYWAIKVKREGKIKRIVAGPNLVVSPKNEGCILACDEVDRIIVPSDWVRDFYLLINPKLSRKIRVWTAGVDSGHTLRSDKKVILVYKKQVQEELFSLVTNILKKFGILFRVVEYGSYKKYNYFRMLEDAMALIYLTETESQGLALAEAWMHDVPTLVWDRGFFEFEGVRVSASSAPYLTDECGISFSGEDDFKTKLDLFLSRIHNFHPREYARKNFIHKVAAQRYLDIIREMA